MVRFDPAFERISRRLTSLELRARTADDDADDLLVGDPHGRTHGDFVHTYSEAGIERVLLARAG